MSKLIKVRTKPGSLSWSEIKAENPPPARHSHGSALVGRKIYVFCGTDGKSLFNDMWIFDLDKNAWSKAAVRGSITARSNPGVAVFDKKIFVYGGSGPSGLLGDQFVFDTGTNVFFFFFFWCVNHAFSSFAFELEELGVGKDRRMTRRR